MWENSIKLILISELFNLIDLYSVIIALYTL